MCRSPAWPGPVGARSARSIYPPMAGRAGRKRSYRHRCIRRRIPGSRLTGPGKGRRRCSCLAARMNGVKFSRRARSCIVTGASPARKRKNPTAPFISMPCSHGAWLAMGAYTMRCSLLSLLVPAVILAAPAVGLAQWPKFNVGTPLSQEEILGFDFMIGPEGKELPAGRGTAKEGAVVFAKRCEVCHGQNGERGVLRRLVLGSPGKPYGGPFKENAKDSVSSSPYAPLPWASIHRPTTAPNPGARTPAAIFS